MDYPKFKIILFRKKIPLVYEGLTEEYTPPFWGEGESPSTCLNLFPYKVL